MKLITFIFILIISFQSAAQAANCELLLKSENQILKELAELSFEISSSTSDRVSTYALRQLYKEKILQAKAVGVDLSKLNQLISGKANEAQEAAATEANRVEEAQGNEWQFLPLSFDKKIEWGGLRSVIMTPDAKNLVIHDARGVHLVDLEIEKIIHSFGDQENAKHIALSPDGKYLAIGMHYSGLVVRDLVTGELLPEFKQAYKKALKALPKPPPPLPKPGVAQKAGSNFVQFSKDGSHIISMTESGMQLEILKLQSNGSFTELFGESYDYQENVLGFAISDDNKLIALTHNSGQISIIDIDKNQTLFSNSYKQIEAVETKAINFDPQGTSLAIGFENSYTFHWDSIMGGRYLLTENKNKPAVYAYNSTNEKSLNVSKAMTIVLKHDGQNTVVDRFSPSEILDVEFSEDDQYFTVRHRDGPMVIYEALSGNKVHKFTEQTKYIMSYNYAQGGRYLMTASYDNSIIIRSRK